MNSKRHPHIRVSPEVKQKYDDLSIELSAIQRKRVSVPEVNRRLLNIPNIANILKKDAEMKRRLK